MKIILENIGRRFNREWIFRNVNYTFQQGQSYAILGANGSGKSTLLQIIASSLTSSEGIINYQEKDKTLDVESVYSRLSLAAPYLELIEEFTLLEQIKFHFKFKPYHHEMDAASIMALLDLEKSKNKSIKYFSSGMKQRVKLALAFCSDTAVLLLDEPTSNLDTQGIDWYLNLVNRFSKNRLTIICSNQAHEYQFCDNKLDILDYK